MNPHIAKLIRKHRIEALLKRGVARDPIAKHNREMSPERILRFIAKHDGEAFPPQLWESIECAQSVGSNGDFAGFTRDVRALAYELGLRDVPMYGGVLRTVSRMMAGAKRQNRLHWVGGDMKVAKRGETLLFIGDLPYYEEVFASDLAFHPLDTARGAVKLLNAIGIVPVVMRDEVSSGIDELWSGDVATFLRLAGKNIRAIKRTGAKRIIVLDSESLFALRKEYRRVLKGFKLPVMHISQIVAPKLGKLTFDRIEERAAYHDPCRMGRTLKVFDPPRKMLGALLKAKPVKMKHEREKTLCTAAHRFSNSGAVAKLMQLDVLKEAENAGADVLVTSCPREAINLKLATRSESWKQTNVEARELTSLAAELYRGD